MQKGVFGLLFVLFFSSVSFAKMSEGGVDQKTLKSMIASQASLNHQPIGYKTARVDLFGDLSLEKKGNSLVIVDVYCESDFKAPGAGHIPDNDVLNVEHTWPQSKFGGPEKGSQKSDLHHLYPCDSQMNSTRGNNPFGVVVNPRDDVKCSKSRFGENAQGMLVFEPPAGHKGNVARALFYFSIRYRLPIDSIQESVLREWHRNDPVDEDERERNTEIQELQGNRNPFIDQPELVDALDDF